jgi:amphiphysin
LELEKTFNEFSNLVEVLAKDAGLFRDSIACKPSFSFFFFFFFFLLTTKTLTSNLALLSSQAAMAQYLATIYDSSIGTEVPEGTVQKRFQQTPANQLQAANDAEAAMAYCRDEVLPELVSFEGF